MHLCFLKSTSHPITHTSIFFSCSYVRKNWRRSEGTQASEWIFWPRLKNTLLLSCSTLPPQVNNPITWFSAWLDFCDDLPEFLPLVNSFKKSVYSLSSPTRALKPPPQTRADNEAELLEGNIKMLAPTEAWNRVCTNTSVQRWDS